MVAGNKLISKMECFGRLPEPDRKLLVEVTRQTRLIEPRQEIIHEGDNPSDVYVILEGFACRHKTLAGGTRQIVSYLLPGDFCNAHVFILREMDHSIATLSSCRLAEIPRPLVLEMLERPALARAMWWASLVDEATLREWIVSMGRRDAVRGIGHLLCELNLRLEAVGLSNANAYRFPVTQDELADTMGLSTVHVNRALQALRKHGFITMEKQEVVLLDPSGLRQFAGFTPNYLHLAPRVTLSAQGLAEG